MADKALITGASSGIGLALAQRMASRGVEVWLAARRLDRLEAAVAGINAAGGTAHAIAIDVADAAATAAAVEKLDADCGGIDIAVANAGIGGHGRRVSQTSWQDASTMFATNLTGALATLLPLMPKMIARGHGHLVGVSSMAAQNALAAAADYGTSKAALTFFLECAQCELPALGVDVTIVHPGFVKSDLTAKNKFPMPFLVETADAARFIDDGIKARARFVKFPLGIVALTAFGNMMPKALRNAVVGRSVPK